MQFKLYFTNTDKLSIGEQQMRKGTIQKKLQTKRRTRQEKERKFAIWSILPIKDNILGKSYIFRYTNFSIVVFILMVSYWCPKFRTPEKKIITGSFHQKPVSGNNQKVPLAGVSQLESSYSGYK